ncbi:MAG: DUF1203 domain-containing protein [Pseudomonadota bacterium]
MPEYNALETSLVRDLQSGRPDANGQPAEHAISDGVGNPCRHCLHEIPKGAPMLILAHRPFPVPQPYAEVGPIFLCAEQCPRGGGRDLPHILTSSPDYLVKGYDAHNRIHYGTGAIVPRATLKKYAEYLLQQDDVAYLHVRSARNNCYQLRIDRG